MRMQTSKLTENCIPGSLKLEELQYLDQFCAIKFSVILGSYFICSVQHWKRQWHPTPILLPGKSNGWRSLVGCSPWGREESGTTERLHFHFSLSCIGEGNGNPLQCSCLEGESQGRVSLVGCHLGSHRVQHD